MPRLHAAVEETWRARKLQRGLRDVVARVGFDVAAELFALRGCAVRTDQHAVAARFAHRLDHISIKVIQHVLPLRRPRCTR